jgi:HipA-like protein
VRGVVKALAERIWALWDQFDSWGTRMPRATPETGLQVRVYGPGGGAERQLIGVLWQERGEFVFRYDLAFARSPGAKAISAFPDLEDTYTSRQLWPFFAVRIPPPERADVRDVLAKHGIKPEQTLEVLGTVAKRSISNPYQLDLAAAP